MPVKGGKSTYWHQATTSFAKSLPDVYMEWLEAKLTGASSERPRRVAGWEAYEAGSAGSVGTKDSKPHFQEEPPHRCSSDSNYPTCVNWCPGHERTWRIATTGLVGSTSDEPDIVELSTSSRHSCHLVIVNCLRMRHMTVMIDKVPRSEQCTHKGRLRP